MLERIDTGLIMGALVIGALVTPIVFFSILLEKQYQAERICLAKGYPKAYVTMERKAYCIKRVNQTDVVVPLEELIDRP